MSTTTTKLCRKLNKIMVYVETVTIIYCNRLTKEQFTKTKKQKKFTWFTVRYWSWSWIFSTGFSNLTKGHAVLPFTLHLVNIISCTGIFISRYLSLEQDQYFRNSEFQPSLFTQKFTQKALTPIASWCDQQQHLSLI